VTITASDSLSCSSAHSEPVEESEPSFCHREESRRNRDDVAVSPHPVILSFPPAHSEPVEESEPSLCHCEARSAVAISTLPTVLLTLPPAHSEPVEESEPFAIFIELVSSSF